MAGSRSVRGAGIWLGVVLVFIVLVLTVPAVPALGSHPVNSSAAHETKTVARVTSIPEAPAASPSVAYTLDLCSNHLYSGNALPTDCGNLAPKGVAYDSGKGEVFVANWLSHNVSVISDATNKVVAAIPVGANPDRLVYDSGKGEVFVANYGSNNVSVISDATNKVVATIPVGTWPTGVAYDSGKGEVFVTNEYSNNVSVISDTSNSVVATIPAGSSPLGVAYDSGKGEVFVANWNSHNVSVISDASNSVVATIVVGGNPRGVAYDSGKAEVFVANYGSNSVNVISDASDTVVASIPVGAQPVNPGYDSGNGEVLVTNSNSNNVSVISDASNKVEGSIPVGAVPWVWVYDNGNGYGYVSNYNQGTVSIFISPIYYSLTFSESGLPAGMSWTMGVNGSDLSSTNSTINFLEPNGTYNYTVINAGYLGPPPSPPSGQVTIAGSPARILITFPGSYRSIFYERGLPSKTQWSFWLTLPSGVQYKMSTYGSNISIMLANGTWPFSVNPVPGYTANPSGGAVVVNGSAVNQTIIFAPAAGTYTVTFLEGGLPNGTHWSITLNGTIGNAVAPAPIAFTEPNGTYPFTVGTVTGYMANVTSSNVTVTGASFSRPITFTPQTTLTGVAVSPFADTLTVGTYANFTATPTCTGGPCSGVTYSWSLNDTALGNLNTSSGASVKFTATASGTENLSVTAMSNGKLAKNSSTITITTTPVPTLAYVSLTPLTATVNVSGTQTFTAAVGCSGGTCPSGSTYTWSLNNSLGKLNTSSGPQVLFTANSTAGLVNLTVTAHLNGKTAINSSTITIKKASPPPSTYAVTFSESGLPSGTTWSVTLSGAMKSGTGSIAFTEPNGSYSFSVGAVPGYTASPTSGSFTVSGVAVSKAITFTALPPGEYSLTFSATGLPTGTNWSVTVGATTHTSTGSTISFTEANGTYSYTVGAVAGYTATPSSGSVTVNGAAETVSLAFAKASTETTYSVTFTETGLPTGTSWSVTLNGSTKSSTTATIAFQEPNGSYAFTVGSVSGYTVGPSPGTIKVNGAAISQAITFTSSTSPGKTNQTTGILGLPGYDGYILVGVVVAAAAAGVVILLLRKRSPPRGEGVQDSKNIADGAAEQVAVE